jgi:hypothetical protein
MANLTETAAWDDVYQIETTDPVVGGAPNPGTGAGMSNIPHLQLLRRTKWLRDELEKLTVTAPIAVTVGSGGNYATINAALAALSNRAPAYVSGGISATITLLAGFVMAEQVIVTGVNLGWITLLAQDAEVTINRSALTTVPAGETARYPAFGAYDGGYLPIIGCQFVMNTSGSSAGRDGIRLNGGGSGARILSGCGVRNAGGCGLRATRGAAAVAISANFSGALEDGIVANTSSLVDAEAVNVSNAGGTCIVANSCGQVNAPNCVATGGGVNGVRAATGASINVFDGNARRGGANDPTDIAVQNGGIVSALNCIGGPSQTANTVTSSGIIFK